MRFSWSVSLLVLSLLANTSRCQPADDAPVPQLPPVPDIHLPHSAGLDAIEHAGQLLRSGKKQQALDELTRIIDSESGTIDEHYYAMVNRGRAWAELGKPDKALADYRGVIESPRAVYVLKRQALLEQVFFVDYRTSDWKAVIADASQLLVLADAKEGREGREIYRTAALMCRAWAYSETGESAKAITDYNDALSEPGLSARDLISLHLSRAVVYSDMHRTAEMADDLQWVINSPDTPEPQRSAARQALDAIHKGGTTKPATKPTSR